GARELRVKESDRIHAMAINLKALGAQIQETDDGWIIKGRKTLSGGRAKSFGDHRVAMAMAVAGLVATGPVCIEDEECVSISYPGFFDDLTELTQTCLKEVSS
ncbi:MAG: 3-phosphoshikimate 1-carboxyvinyltransferase, partial [Acetomicrobium flavidum]|nr:3-phosphoshikimate 1-carboxyvinyltransferase [Acetomicrobium flavidum]